MFFDSGIEAVAIASPAPCHKENVLDAARCGLPILCEKPLAMDRGEAAEMVAATDAAGVSLYTAFCYRFSPCVLKIRELLASKAIGDVRSLRLIYNWNCHGKFDTDASGNPTIQTLEKLAALVPPPRLHLLRYHGVLAPRARDRGRIVPTKPVAEPAADGDTSAPSCTHRLGWAALLARVFSSDLSACATCGGRLRIVAA